MATLIGYQVTNTVTGLVHDLSSAGTVIDAVRGAAGNAIGIDSLAFSVSNTRSIEDRARSYAVSQAVSHAKAMAAAAYEHLGQLCSLSD
ncbi:MAG: SIMPL domain-containing protein [Actinobacteria bacterium]|nr:SIMPL domain-containing protein [Actinomycetota bacterium]